MEFQYRGLHAKLETVEVTEQEVDKRMMNLLKNSRRRIPVVGRAAQSGDELVLDYAGYADGVQFAGGTAQNQTLVLGSHTFIPGFEEQLIGHNAGEDVLVHVTFPKEYHAPELAGKEAEFRCHIHAINKTGDYEMNEIFAKEVGQSETIDEMRKKMRESLEAYYHERAEMELGQKLLQLAAKTIDFAPDEASIQKACEIQMDTLSAQLAQKGLKLEDYCKFTGKTMKELFEESRPEAIETIKIKEVVDRVSKLENMEISPEETQKALGEVCKANHMTMEQLQPFYDETFAAALADSIRLAKVTKLLRENAILDA